MCRVLAEQGKGGYGSFEYRSYEEKKVGSVEASIIFTTACALEDIACGNPIFMLQVSWIKWAVVTRIWGWASVTISEDAGTVSGVRC